MQRLSRAIMLQLRHLPSLHGGCSSVAAAPSAVAAGGLLSIARGFSTDGHKRLYFGNLSFEATQEQVQAVFEKYGSIHEIHMPTMPDGRHRGFGFVTLDQAAAEAALSEVESHSIGGRALNVQEANNQAPEASREHNRVFSRPGFRRLYVGNLSYRTTAADLGTHFQKFGDVQDVVIPLDAVGRSRGFGFVEVNETGAVAAAQELDGSLFDGRYIIVRDQK